MNEKTTILNRIESGFDGEDQLVALLFRILEVKSGAGHPVGYSGCYWLPGVGTVSDFPGRPGPPWAQWERLF